MSLAYYETVPVRAGEKLVVEKMEPPMPEVRVFRVFEVPGPRPVKPVERSEAAYGVEKQVYLLRKGRKYLIVEFVEIMDQRTGKPKRRVIFTVYKNGYWNRVAYIRHSNQLEYIADYIRRLIGNEVEAARLLMRAEWFLRTGSLE